MVAAAAAGGKRMGEHACAGTATLQAEGAAAEWIDGAAIRRRVPVVRPEAAALRPGRAGLGLG